MLSIELELQLRDETDVDITACKSRAHWEHAASTTRHADDADSELGSLCLNISRINEINRCLGSCVLSEGPVHEGDVVIDARRDHDHLQLRVVLASQVSDMFSLTQSADATDEVELGDSTLDARIIAFTGFAPRALNTKDRATFILDSV